MDAQRKVTISNEFWQLFTENLLSFLQFADKFEDNLKNFIYISGDHMFNNGHIKVVKMTNNKKLILRQETFDFFYC